VTIEKVLGEKDWGEKGPDPDGPGFVFVFMGGNVTERIRKVNCLQFTVYGFIQGALITVDCEQ
jgi:hypothetical protein